VAAIGGGNDTVSHMARSRALAWLVTGPLGHVAAGIADWAAVAWKVLYARARGRKPDW
jgi:hypothetical protein